MDSAVVLRNLFLKGVLSDEDLVLVECALNFAPRGGRSYLPPVIGSHEHTISFDGPDEDDWVIARVYEGQP
jgi:hypothetical protein